MDSVVRFAFAAVTITGRGLCLPSESAATVTVTLNGIAATVLTATVSRLTG